MRNVKAGFGHAGALGKNLNVVPPRGSMPFRVELNITGIGVPIRHPVSNGICAISWGSSAKFWVRSTILGLRISIAIRDVPL